MKVVEYIKETSQKLQYNQVQLLEKLEPQVREFSDLIHEKINQSKAIYFKGAQFKNIYPLTLAKKPIPVTPQAKALYNALLPRLNAQVQVGDWYRVEQQLINQFGELTGDEQWIHTDDIKARKHSPYRSTVAHGYLIIALLPKLANIESLIEQTGIPAKFIVNSGLKTLTFHSPVKPGTQIRAKTTLMDLSVHKRGVELTLSIIIESEQSQRLVCSLENIIRIYI